MQRRHYTFTNIHSSSGFEPSPYGMPNHYTGWVTHIGVVWKFAEWGTSSGSTIITRSRYKITRSCAGSPRVASKGN
ncbi:hypothetical protein TNCV_2376431 [Trichonephila clavipes]|nr:hypothetical protein TNCV_2376431 [Trichonephila clavipes]